MVMEIVHEEIGESSMQCANHPYRNSAPGGICAFCLQEKLGKLVSSSFHAPIFPSSSSSSSPSFRSDFGSRGAPLPGVATGNVQNKGPDGNYNGYYPRRSKLPFVLTHRKKQKKKDGGGTAGGSDPTIIFKRSKSTATPRRGMQFMDEDYSSNKRGFWSFLYLPKHHSSVKKPLKSLNHTNVSTAVGSSSGSSSGKKREELVAMDENSRKSPDDAPPVPIERKVSRSRSVGCGSRSFSGDFFERISTGFGDCTLRRVESQREGKQKVESSTSSSGLNVAVNGEDCIKERVRSCGGIFSGFMLTSSSSTSSYLVASSSSSSSMSGGHLRSKSWGWAFASPMRAFGKPSSSATKRVAASQNKNNNNNNNATPNLAAIPSLLAVSG